MLKRRTFLKAAGTATALSSIGFPRLANAQSDNLNWFVNSDLSGPAAYSSAAEAEGIQDFVDWINASGGVGGRQISLTVKDTGFKPAVSVANFNQAVAAGRLDYVYADSTGMVQAVSPENNTTHKIFMGGGSHASELADPGNYPYYIVNGATYRQQMVALVQHVADTQGNDAKLAIVHSSISFGRDGVDAAVAAAEELGVEVVLVQQTSFIETDVSAFALAIRQAQPTHVIFHGYAMAVWPEIVRLVRDYGMDDVVFMGTLWQNEREKIMELGDIADGLIGVAVVNIRTEGAEGEMLKVIDGIQREKDPNYTGYLKIGYVDGWLDAMLAAKATEMVMEAGEEVNGDNLIKAVTSLKDWDTGGIIETPVTFKNNAIGLVRVFEWKKDGWVPEPVSDWMLMD
ncbi:ABC transporter substrate-binding protein [Oricola indica]|uniref:ABC transporter substrate-binding protein n=1 Tax=Oricola indica TaxID=2872591 RepID=UPI001CC1385D|nr:ABC transporter substrate-binding protein [Oricola indica]